MGFETERAARTNGTIRLELGGVRRSPRDPDTTAGGTSESFERSIAALSAQLSAHFAEARPESSEPDPPEPGPAPAAPGPGPVAPDLGFARRADPLPRQKRQGQERQGQERQGRQVGENAGRLRGYAFALPLVSGIGAAAAVACSFYFFSDRGTVTPPPSPPRTTTATAPSLPPPSPPAPGIVEPAAAAPPPKTSPAAPVEPKEVDPKEVDPKAVEAKAVAPAPDGNTPGKNILDRSEVLALQTQLKALGLNPGPLDGVAGPQTAAAVRRYEESRGRRPTGFVDRDLLMRLQQEQPSKTTRR